MSDIPFTGRRGVVLCYDCNQPHNQCACRELSSHRMCETELNGWVHNLRNWGILSRYPGHAFFAGWDTVWREGPDLTQLAQDEWPNIISSMRKPLNH